MDGTGGYWTVVCLSLRAIALNCLIGLSLRRGCVDSSTSLFPHAWGTPPVAGVRVARRRWASRARAQRAATVAA